MENIVDYHTEQCLPALHQLLTIGERLIAIYLYPYSFVNGPASKINGHRLPYRFPTERILFRGTMVRYLKDCCGFFHLRYATVIIAVLQIVSNCSAFSYLLRP